MIRQHNRFCRGDYELEFYTTDRELSQICKCSRVTVLKTKRKLEKIGLIRTRSGDRKRTYYRFILQPKSDSD